MLIDCFLPQHFSTRARVAALALLTAAGGGCISVVHEQASCGDGVCADEETCDTCGDDCGSCAASCPDGTCDAEESSQSCPQDCGDCDDDDPCTVDGREAGSCASTPIPGCEATSLLIANGFEDGLPDPFNSASTGVAVEASSEYAYAGDYSLKLTGPAGGTSSSTGESAVLMSFAGETDFLLTVHHYAPQPVEGSVRMYCLGDSYVYWDSGNVYTQSYQATFSASDEWGKKQIKIVCPAESSHVSVRFELQEEGTLYIDHAVLSRVSLTFDYSVVDAKPNNPDASPEAVALYDYLRSIYGQYTLSGQTDQNYDDFVTAFGKSPVVKAWDFNSYSPMFAYGWDNGCSCQVFGATEYGQTQGIIDDYEAAGGKLIPTVQWHWYSPSGGQVSTNTFSTDQTTFDVRLAVTPGTTEYEETLRDIDAIAARLQILDDANVPILWRPLHEADGRWFWWGAHGPEPLKALYRLMYERLTAHHGLNNLLWVWTRALDDTEWYPGNDVVDIHVKDSYPGAYNYITELRHFQAMYLISGGQKMIALGENGAVPDIDACYINGAHWLYHVTWMDQYATKNSVAHITETINHERVITLDER